MTAEEVVNFFRFIYFQVPVKYLDEFYEVFSYTYSFNANDCLRIYHQEYCYKVVGDRGYFKWDTIELPQELVHKLKIFEMKFRLKV